ncbi:putative BRCT domain-containing protein [Lupinus albus]|uniref:Putative BRCT domain-containing protein n=1 Tax=Lupinus albus TaxID=3870 RepID=A0A6A4NBM6_LUPAL|nr:putative BRCT domain-containing protein [Lupinus albus]
MEPLSSASSSMASEQVHVRSRAPFAGLVICVTGLSKEARNQVMEATQRLGGQYSPNLNPQCTHLVFDHALKHGAKSGLFIVTLGWFVDSVRKNVTLSESHYRVKSYGDNNMRLDENSFLPAKIRETKHANNVEEIQRFSGRESNRSSDLTLSGCSIYVDACISCELRNKVVESASREGASLVEQWFVGCNVSHVVTEGTSIQRYLGYSSNLITPLWILKTVKAKNMQRLVHMSADLARQVGLLLENNNDISGKEVIKQKVHGDLHGGKSEVSYKERQQIVNSAKIDVRNRRGRRMQTCQTPIRPITPNNLLDSICWSISEPTSSASIYTDSSSVEDPNHNPTSTFFDAKDNGKDPEASFSNSTRPLTESEKSELIFKNHFLTVLFPIDRFSEMGPSSRTFFSNNGFTCLQVLDYIHAFYEENMSKEETEAAIHTDSRHADRLRSVYSSKETTQSGYVIFKRIEFLGSCISFEMLKRVTGDNNSNVYELLLRA